MITESFLNSCFSLVLCNSKVRKTKDFYRDILEIIESYEKKETLEIPLVVKNKVDCLKKICSMSINGKTVDNILDSISFSEKFKQYQDFLSLKYNEELKDNIVEDIIKQIRLRKKINSLFINYDDLSNVLETIRDGSFDSIDDIVEDYEVTIKKLYSNMMENNRAITIEASASLDLAKDNYDHVVEMIKKKYERKNTTPSGIPIFDNDVFMGGFEPSRLYIFGGGSGAGKSTLLSNFIIKSISSQRNILDAKLEPNTINKVYIYITMENTIEEALLRIYQPLFDRTTIQVLRDISQDVDIKQKMNDELSKNNATIIMKYFPAMSISPTDIMSVIDDAITTYGKDAIAGVYIDYLDLLRSDTRYDLYRLELGHITLSLKTLAVQYNVPVITVSQLGRSVYYVQSSKDLSVGMMGESIKKVEHADFIALIAKDNVDDSVVYCSVGKNRSGKSGINITFKVDFEKFNFLTASLVSNKDKKDDMTIDDKVIHFGGFDTNL